MNNKSDAIERLRQEIQQLREKIELGDDSLPIELGFPKLLMGIDETLASDTLNVKKMEQYTSGIYRLVTESYTFEQSGLGKQLLALIPKLKDLSRT